MISSIPLPITRGDGGPKRSTVCSRLRRERTSERLKCARPSARGGRDSREGTPIELERAAPRSARLFVAGRLLVFERRLEEAVTEAGIDVELMLHAGPL